MKNEELPHQPTTTLSMFRARLTAAGVDFAGSGLMMTQVLVLMSLGGTFLAEAGGVAGIGDFKGPRQSDMKPV